MQASGSCSSSRGGLACSGSSSLCLAGLDGKKETGESSEEFTLQGIEDSSFPQVLACDISSLSLAICGQGRGKKSPPQKKNESFDEVDCVQNLHAHVAKLVGATAKQFLLVFQSRTVPLKNSRILFPSVGSPSTCKGSLKEA